MVFISPSQPSAISDEDMAVHVVASRGTQKYGRACDVVRLAPTASWNALENLPTADRIVAQGGRVVGSHVAGRNRIYVDTLDRPLVRQGLCELCNATFGCSVRRHEDPPLKRQHRCNVYDLSRFRLREHLLTGELREVEGRRQINGNDLIPIFRGDFCRRRAPNCTGVIHKDVDGPEFGNGLLDQRSASPRLGDIGGEIKCLSAQRANLLGGPPWLRVTSMAADIRPSLRQGDRNRSAEPSMRAGYQGILVVEVERFEPHSLYACSSRVDTSLGPKR